MTLRLYPQVSNLRARGGSNGQLPRQKLKRRRDAAQGADADGFATFHRRRFLALQKKAELARAQTQSLIERLSTTQSHAAAVVAASVELHRRWHADEPAPAEVALADSI